MNINVHIERLVLDGIPLAGRQGAVLQAGIEEKLTRLLRKEGLSGISETAIERLSGGMIQLSGEIETSHLGQQIAESIYTAIEPNRAAEGLRSHSGESSRK